ncbi:unnamed protein product [Pedinophyceae sp. YPF-701]|nr:unnamed protein product [Pedinophyceae sp. YPF-701]
MERFSMLDVDVDVARSTLPSRYGGSCTVRSVGVQLALTHTYLADLEISLRSPGGPTSQLLMDQVSGSSVSPSGSGANIDILLTDSATTSVSSLNSNTGSFAPSPGSLSAFAGVSAVGTWEVVISDVLGGDSGELLGLDLILTCLTGTTSTDLARIRSACLTVLAVPVTGAVAEGLSRASSASSVGEGEYSCDALSANHCGVYYGVFFLNNQLQFVVEWTLSGHRNMTSFFSAYRTGAAYSYRVYDPAAGSVVTSGSGGRMSLSDNMGYTGGCPAALSGDDGVWMASDAAGLLHGDTSVSDFCTSSNRCYGFGNFDSLDSSADDLYEGRTSSSGTVKAYIVLKEHGEATVATTAAAQTTQSARATTPTALVTTAPPTPTPSPTVPPTQRPTLPPVFTSAPPTTTTPPAATTPPSTCAAASCASPADSAAVFDVLSGLTGTTSTDLARIRSACLTVLAVPVTGAVAEGLSRASSASSVGEGEYSCDALSANHCGVYYGVFFLNNQLQFVVEWTLSGHRNMTSFFSAYRTGAAYSYRVYDAAAGSVVTSGSGGRMSLSDNMGYAGGCPAALSGDDGAWMASDAAGLLHGDTSVSDFCTSSNRCYGFGNFNDGDSSADDLYEGRTSTSGTVKAYIVLKVCQSRVPGLPRAHIVLSTLLRDTEECACPSAECGALLAVGQLAWAVVLCRCAHERRLALAQTTIACWAHLMRRFVCWCLQEHGAASTATTAAEMTRAASATTPVAPTATPSVPTETPAPPATLSATSTPSPTPTSASTTTPPAPTSSATAASVEPVRSTFAVTPPVTTPSSSTNQPLSYSASGLPRLLPDRAGDKPPVTFRAPRLRRIRAHVATACSFSQCHLIFPLSHTRRFLPSQCVYPVSSWRAARYRRATAAPAPCDP